jgi:HK97 family phage prohead protease
MPKLDIEQLKAMPKLIFRRSAEDLTFNEEKGVIDGYPIVFNKRTDIAGLFYEEIDEHALDEADLSDIKFLINHENNMIPLARHRRGKRSTMDIDIDNVGLRITAHLDIENNANAKALHSAVKRGDIEDMSFAFCVEIAGEEWNDLDKDMPIRRITKFLVVREVSAVNDGAYPQTYISARSATLDNEKKVLDNARAVSLDNEKRQKQAEAALRLQKQKFIFMEEEKK